MGTYTKEQLTAQLNRIKDATAACRTAIINKGIFWTPNDAKLEDLAQYASFICDYPDIRLEYLQADETPSVAQKTTLYYQTDFYPDSSTDIEVSYQLTYADSTVLDGVLIGCTHTTSAGYSFSADHFIAAPGSSSSTLYGWKYRNNSLVLSSSSVLPDTNKHIIRTHCDGTAQTVYYDGNSTSGTTSATRMTFELPMNIFTNNQNGSGAAYVVKGTRIYYIKIWKSGNLERFYIPVLHWNGTAYVPCFYDKVNDSYIYKSGTGTVVYQMTDDLLLDYIGAQPESEAPTTAKTNIRYYTGVVPSAGLQVDTRFRLIWGSENYIYGAATDNTTTPTWQVFGIGYPGALGTMRANFAANNSTVLYANMTSQGTTAVNTASLFYENNIGKCILNGTAYTSSQSSPTVTQFPTTDIHLFSRHGNSQNVDPVNGARIYYCLLTTSYIPNKTIIPVLHNGSPAFYDMTTNTYLTKGGSGTPYYEKL